ncbi:MAG: pyridoxal-dependent decarboxylase [Alphaproteobacteria bacterium]
MDSQEFREHAHAFVDWMADYLADVEQYPVRAQVEPGEIAARLPAAPPEEAEPMARIFADFRDLIVPGMTHWQHPGFFAFFPANSSPPSVLAEMLTATLGAQCMIWQTSPAATELETRVLEWLRRMTGLPEGFVGVIQDTASTATLCAIITARERATGFAANEAGLGAVEELTVYCSEEAHSSVEKDVKIAGLGRRSLRLIACDDDFAMAPDALEQAIEADLAAGRKPACVVATLGTTGVGGFDPLRPLGEICRRHGIWLHVDAAWAGSALILARERWMIDGVEYVDSFVFNPHKWLFTNFDCSAYFVRDAEALTRSFEIMPEFLKTAEDDRVYNYRDWGIPLGRRFRALKLWFVIRAYGVEGLRRRISAHLEAARELADEVAAADDFEVLAPVKLALVCFRYRPDGVDEGALDGLNQRLLERLNASGALYLTHTRIRGAYAIRLVVGQTTTRREHVRAAWRTIQETARAL